MEHKEVTFEQLIFCPYSGCLLDDDFISGDASCALSGYKMTAEELMKRKIVTHVNMKSYRRRFGLKDLVPDKGNKQATKQDDNLNQRQRATIDEACPKCGKIGLDFYTLQLRSADEGQTVFYECKKCGHKYSQNN